MKIHREGITTIITTAIVLVIIDLIALYFLPRTFFNSTTVITISIFLFLVVLQFFRYPNRELTRNDDYLIAPADGKVVSIEEVAESEYFKGNRKLISIFMSPVNVHANWYPMSGQISYLRYHKGKKLVAWHPKSSTENERTTMVITQGSKAEILIRQIAGALANRIIYYPHEGDMVRQGAELGFIKFGSRVDMYIPLDAQVNVKINQKVKGGVSIIALLN
jgi:phosphatidylserine decarboxylase